MRSTAVTARTGLLVGQPAPERPQVEVTELGAQPTGALVVEGAIYRNVGTELWGAGASLPATRMP